jgi:hypothetical protein
MIRSNMGVLLLVSRQHGVTTNSGASWAFSGDVTTLWLSMIEELNQCTFADFPKRSLQDD